MVRKAVAGLLIGVCAAAIVLALTNLEAFRTGRAQNLRLAPDAHREPSTARKDIALVEIDEDSLRNLQPNCGPMAVAARRAREPHRLPQSRQAGGSSSTT